MRQIVIILICCFSILGCDSSQEPEKPANLISKDKMVEVLIDLSIISSAKGVNKKILEKNGITPDKYVYDKHQIDSTQFSQSNAYYSFYVDDYKNILARVQDSLDKLRFKYNRLAEKDENKKKQKNTEEKKKRKQLKNIDSLITN